MAVKVWGSTEKQTVEVLVGLDDGSAAKKAVIFRFEKDKVNEAEMTFDLVHWHPVVEAKVAIDAFVSKYPTFAMEE
jgi:hypothetical protein